MRGRRKPRINRPRSVSARERNPEFVAFTNRFVRLFKNEITCVSGEIARSDNLRLRFHARRLQGVSSDTLRTLKAVKSTTRLFGLVRQLPDFWSACAYSRRF